MQEILKQIEPTSENIKLVALYLKSIDTKNYINFHNWAMTGQNYSMHDAHNIWHLIINLLDSKTATDKLVELSKQKPEKPVKSLQKIKNLDQLFKNIKVVTLRNNDFFLCAENAFNVFHVLWFEKRWREAFDVYKEFSVQDSELQKVSLKSLIKGAPESIAEIIDDDIISQDTKATLNLAYGQIPFISKSTDKIGDGDIVFCQEKRQYGKVLDGEIIFPDNTKIALTDKDTLFVKHKQTLEIGDVVHVRNYYAIITRMSTDNVDCVFSDDTYRLWNYSKANVIKDASKIVSSDIRIGNFVRVDIGKFKSDDRRDPITIRLSDNVRFEFKRDNMIHHGEDFYTVKDKTTLPIGKVVDIQKDDFMIAFRCNSTETFKFGRDQVTLIASSAMPTVLDDIYLMKNRDNTGSYVRLYDLTCDFDLIIEDLVSGSRSTYNGISIEHIGTPIKTLHGSSLELPPSHRFDDEILCDLFTVSIPNTPEIIVALKAENWWMTEHLLKEHFKEYDCFDEFYFPQETLDRLKSMASEEQWNSLKKIKTISTPYVNPVTEDSITKILDSM